MTPTAIIQVKPGIGDVIWHLPFIRAIAAGSPGGRVTFLAPPTSRAEELLAVEPAVAGTLYFEHDGSELRRCGKLIALTALLRRQRFRTLWILDRTIRPALAATLAGIPERIGLGLGVQRLFITNDGIADAHFHDHPIDWLRALMAVQAVPFSSTEPALRLPPPVLAAIGRRFAASPRPWLALGLGASHPAKDWPDEHWADFLRALRRRTDGTVFLIGGGCNTARAQGLIAASAGGTVVNACDLALIEAAALLAHADLFVGPSSGPLNLAAAVGTEAFGLFGSTPVLTYSTYIRAIVPEGGPSPDGMRRIWPAQVLACIAARLQPAAGPDGRDVARVAAAGRG